MAPSTIRRKPSSRTDRNTSTLRYGDRFGRYLITGFAGEGATSYVYRARRGESFDPVAIKVLHPDMVADPEKRRKFFNEARLMLRMDHPNVVEFHEIVETDGMVGFVMEYIDGVTLDRWLRLQQEPIEEQALAGLFIDILRGVAHAHDAGVIHRDLKPANIMITEDQSRFCARILDFGVARFADADPHPDEREKIIGTAAYISPEEVRDPDAVGRSSDIYSLGVILYEAATGQRPFSDDDPRNLLYAHARRTPPNPRDFNPKLSPAFEKIILQTLDKDPDRRPGDAGELIDALEGVIRRMFEANARLPSAEANAQTREWSRTQESGIQQQADADDREDLYRYLVLCFQFAFAFLTATGHTGKPDDPHHLNRSDPLHLGP